MSSAFAIRAEGLGKRYRLGGPSRGYRTLRESITDAVTAPRRHWRARRAAAVAQELWALRDVSFTVNQGDVLGVIGRNGAGKSTLLKVLSRITEPSAGTALVRGRVGSLLEVGTGFHPELSGRENILLSGAILGMRRAEILAKFDQIVAFAEIDRFVDTALKHYSSGMYLRLAFAVAAHLEPAILMVDEVLAVGDLAFQRKCLGKMQSVGESGQTVLFVSHDLTAISRLAPATIVLDGGRLAFHGPTAEAIQRYSADQSDPRRGSLAERLDRQGDGLVRVTALRFEDRDGRDVTSIGAGETLAIVVDYESRLGDLAFEDLALDMRFTDVLGHPIATLSTRFGTVPASGLPGRGRLRCEVPRLPLAAETYSLDVWLAYRGGVADVVSGAADVRVVSAPFFSSGDEPVKRKHGAALIDHHWSVAPAERLAAPARAGG